MVDAILAYLLNIGQTLINIPFNLTEKFYFVYLLSFVALAYLSFRLYHRNAAGGQHTGFWRFLFPAKIYTHPSARVDYGIFLINICLSPFLLFSAGLQAWVTSQIGGALLQAHGGQPIFMGNWDAITFAGFILGYTMAADLSVYIVHRLHHRLDILWPLHALHHSAEVLTPVSLFRKHPVWNIEAHALAMLLTGLFQGIFIFFFFGGPGVEILFGINTLYVFYNFFGANLRHSHVWLSWGKPLSYIFISPAMHQIHHDPHRMNKNYGEIFAIWDWMFGSLYIPDKREAFTIGLGEGEENPHKTLWQAYWQPLVAVVQVARNKLTKQRIAN